MSQITDHLRIDSWTALPSIRGHDIWKDVYRADAEMARHAAMYMMVLYYQYGMLAPEDVLPYVMGRS